VRSGVAPQPGQVPRPRLVVWGAFGGGREAGLDIARPGGILGAPVARMSVTTPPPLLHAGIALVPVPLETPSDPAAPMHAFTVDVEDWYQSCIDYDAPITERVLRNTGTILEVLDGCSVRGTFFVQGRVAETFPGMVAELVAAGHEVQSHGYSHRPLDRMAPAALRNELARAKATVEDAAGAEVTAFRAQDFSVLAGNLWALEALAEAGFTTDSSIFPMRVSRYGISGWPLEPHRLILGVGSMLEVPVAVCGLGPLRIPVAGGGYFRLLPERMLERAIRAIGADGRPAVIYCHPYEFAPGELAGHPGLPWKLRVTQEMGRRAFEGRMTALLRRLRFGRLDEVLAAWGIR
jgi:polysaccharide deacetylase family protein (PEP-CTERM system associated)